MYASGSNLTGNNSHAFNRMDTKYLLPLGLIFFLLLITTIALSYQYQTQALAVKKAMVIVEPRKHPDFDRVLKQFDAQMPVDWDLYVFHGKGAKDFLQDITMDITSGRNVYLKSLESDNLTANEYNKLFKQASFWNQINAEDILVFQTDCALCSKSPHNIDRFRKYGYLGCSYLKNSHGFTKQVWGTKHPFYGIGGLSFRKKSFTMKCIRERPNIDPDFAEDVFFSECVHKERGSLKPESADVLCDFCTQHAFNSKSFGAHKTKDLAKGDKDGFYAFCPEAEFLDKQS